MMTYNEIPDTDLSATTNNKKTPTKKKEFFYYTNSFVTIDPGS
jgi:hypothetical protein